MTPDAYKARIRELFEAGQHRTALAFAQSHARAVDPPLTLEDTLLLGDALHISAAVVDAEDHEARQRARTA